MKSATRTPHAVAGAASAGKELTGRSAWFWFFYNWDSREKLVLENSDPRVAEVFKNGEWERIYKISVSLPIPTLLDQREVVELDGSRPPFPCKGDPFIPGQPLAYQIGRRLFGLATHIVPDISPKNPLSNTWETRAVMTKEKTTYPDSASFVVGTLKRKFRITVEEITDDDA